MRSRYAAFALGFGDYLVRTLAEDHDDRALPLAEHIRSLALAHHRQRFMDLRILHASTEGDRGEVLFYARIFERGQDRSFAELSSFQREGSAWRYASGLHVPAERLPEDMRTLDKPAFLALAREGADGRS